jgi:zinc transport system ATP-binding protein
MSDTGAGNLIRCENASFGYNGYRVVRGLSFAVRSGDYLCVVGENGSGKSTLLKGMLSLLHPLEGVVTQAASMKGTGIGYLAQQSAARKDFPAGVREVVLSGLTGGMGLRPFYSRAEKEAAEENMRRLEITGLKKRCFRELSGGQQRRALIARALCATQTLLALDEPAAGLDPLVTAELYGLLQKLNRETGIAIVMVTHDTAAAVRYASHILHVAGEQRFFGGSAEYAQSETGRQFCVRGGGQDDSYSG